MSAVGVGPVIVGSDRVSMCQKLTLPTCSGSVLVTSTFRKAMISACARALP